VVNYGLPGASGGVRGRLMRPMEIEDVFHRACLYGENHWIDDRWLQIVGLFGPTWASLFIVFLFLFSFLLHHCEVTLNNNYVICINIFFIYNSMDTSFHLGVSRFFEWICYFFYHLNEFLRVYRK
jgi:hypothetical protein